MKYCGKCNRLLHEESFHSNSSKKDGLQSHCRECNQKAVDSTRKRNNSFIWFYLRSCCCVDCGEKDTVTLEFDHVSGTKKYNLSDLSNSSCSVQMIVREILKCEVVCANCHRRRHSKRGDRVVIVPDC